MFSYVDFCSAIFLLFVALRYERAHFDSPLSGFESQAQTVTMDLCRLQRTDSTPAVAALGNANVLPILMVSNDDDDIPLL